MGDKDPGQKAVRDAINAVRALHCTENTVFCISSDDAGLSYSSD